MSKMFGVAFILVFVGIVLAATLVLIRGFMRGIKAGRSLPYAPIPVIFPPVPIVRTPVLVVTCVLATAWSVAHLSVLTWWSLTGCFVPRVVAAWPAAVYLSVAAVLVGAGAAAMLMFRPAGRVAVAWGMMMFALVALFGVVMALCLPKYEDAPAWAQRLSRIVAAVAVAHVLFDTAVGAFARRAGRPPGFSDDVKPPAPPELPGQAGEQGLPGAGPAGSDWTSSL